MGHRGEEPGRIRQADPCAAMVVRDEQRSWLFEPLELDEFAWNLDRCDAAIPEDEFSIDINVGARRWMSVIETGGVRIGGVRGSAGPAVDLWPLTTTIEQGRSGPLARPARSTTAARWSAWPRAKARPGCCGLSIALLTNGRPTCGSWFASGTTWPASWLHGFGPWPAASSPGGGTLSTIDSPGS